MSQNTPPISPELTDAKRKQLRELVNCSGYPFQEAIAHLFEADSFHGWEFLGKELPWVLPTTKEFGYTDVLAGRDYLRLLVECKRRQDDDLVFLVPEGSKTSKVGVFIRSMHDKLDPPLAWRSFGFHERSSFYRSLFCGSRGQSKDSQSNFEPHARALLNACHSLALKEVPQKPRGLVFIPMIVVNSKIFVCKYNPAQVSLENGDVPESSILERVPAVYFHKAFRTARDEELSPPANVVYPQDELSRTVLVVSGPDLREVLTYLVPG